MAIDFSLTPEQLEPRRFAREFSQEVLKPLIRDAVTELDTQKAFQMVEPAYDVQIVSEEICAVDPGFGCILLCNGLGLMPLVWYGSDEQKSKWLTEACADPTNSYLAAWNVSEPAGSPGGTAASTSSTGASTGPPARPGGT